MDSKAVLRKLAEDGWILQRVTGSHHQFRHATKPGIVTVPHPKRDLPVGTVKSIEKQAGLRLR
jgi:predicted RNA binding protein YcfA (HicA-like mRNA interferase family)